MMQKVFYFVAHMPDEPGALHKAAEIVTRYRGNVDRIHYDRRIDPYTVFFEIRCDDNAYERIKRELELLGFLQDSLAVPSFLKFNVYLPNRPGALFEFLNSTTSAGCNIAFLDFDDRGKYPERLTVSLTIEDSSQVQGLLEGLKSRYPMEILEYDTSGKHLDDTVFYIRFAQELRQLIGDTEDQFLLQLLSDINHIVQELHNLGEDPKLVFNSVLQTGRTIKATIGKGFYADVQRLEMTDKAQLYCFQLPCGGSVFALVSAEEVMLLDTGYGIYHEDVVHMLADHGIGDLSLIKRIFISHADADHSGGAGFFEAESFAHPGTVQIVERSNRAYGSKLETSILEEVYTRLINMFSNFRPPSRFSQLDGDHGKRGTFRIVARDRFAGMEFEVLESLGGHLHGQIFLLFPAEGFLFTADSLIGFESLTPEREEFNILAKNLMTSVNVDSEKASMERKGLLALATQIDAEMAPSGKRCIICGGHGAISVLESGKLKTYGVVERYKHMNPETK
jgi:glyoxylase-like metal-dependent hydrolase (beta-lactamase superfamily II)/ACT domain-containing protein